MISNTPATAEIASIASCQFLENNCTLLRAHLFRQTHESLSIGAEIIESEMKGLSMLVRPVVSSFYRNVLQRDMERSTRKLVNGMITFAAALIRDDIKVGSDEFHRRLKAKFPGYLKLDQTGRQCKRSHPNFPRLEENLKDTFEAQILGTLPILQANMDEPIKNYPDLCRAAFKNAEECKTSLNLQTDAMLRGQAIIKEDLSILNIVVARDLIFRVLEKGFAQKIEDFNRGIDIIFS